MASDSLLVINIAVLLFIILVWFLSIYLPAKYLSDQQVTIKLVMILVAVMYMINYLLTSFGIITVHMVIKVINFSIVYFFASTRLKLKPVHAVLVAMSFIVFTIIAGLITTEIYDGLIHP